MSDLLPPPLNTFTGNDISHHERCNFQLTFDRIADTVLYCQEIEIPEISLPVLEVPTPSLDFDHIPGDRIVYAPTFPVSFVVDEYLRSYQSVYNWMIAIRHPESIETHQSPAEAWADATVTVLGNNRQPMARIKFFNCMPVSLSTLPLKTNVDKAEPTIVVAAFAFSHFLIEPFNYPPLPTP